MKPAPWRVDYLDQVAREDIPALPKTVRERIKVAIETRLFVDPIGHGKPLRYSLKGHRRLRVGDYRIVYRIDPASRRVVVAAIKHRKNVYDEQRPGRPPSLTRPMCAAARDRHWPGAHPLRSGIPLVERSGRRDHASGAPAIVAS